MVVDLVRKIHWLLSAQFGVDLLKTVRAIVAGPRYLRDLRRFRARYDGRITLTPCLHDWHEEGGATTSEYFWQDLLVARMIRAAAPEKHVDIGSRVDGFVAHVASFRELEVFDVRPITTTVPGVTFTRADMMKLPASLSGYCDSLSCLHALEHFGLGRYGDPIDADGFRHGIASFADLLKPQGVLYLSVPIGVPRVEFNANRVFDPRAIMDTASAHGLALEQLLIVRNGATVEPVIPDSASLAALAEQRYLLGVFVFRRVSTAPIEFGSVTRSAGAHVLTGSHS